NASISRDARKEGLFQHFYRVIQKERDRERSSDCIIVSMDKEQREYATVIGHRLQDHGLVVEMIHLSSESGLTRALQEVKDDGSPFCILVEESNVKLSSCTVIMLHQSVKIHRHMPLEDALVLVAKEYRRLFAKREQQEHTGLAMRAGDLVDDFLARECLPSYAVPLGIRHLLFLLSEGRHLYRHELDLLTDYLKTRRGQLGGFETPNPTASSDHASLQGRSTPIVGKPPPLLPNPGRRTFLGPPPQLPVKSPLLGARPGGGLRPPPGPVNTKGLVPPPLLLAAPCKRPALLGSLPPKPAKRPLLGEKPGLLPPPPGELPVSDAQVHSSARVFAELEKAPLCQENTVLPEGSFP
ncbi:Nuclear receptor coactivator 5, partial [Galemys pyrenaicus]